VYSFGRKIFFVGPTFIAVMVLLFFVFSDPNNDTQEIQKAIQESIMESNTHVEKVVHIEKVENVTLAFYATPKGLAVGRLEQTFRGWELIEGTGYIEFNSGSELPWIWCNMGESAKSLPVYYGIVSNPNIQRVEVDEKHEAEIIATYKDNKIWTLIGQGTSGTEEIQGMTNQGEVIYSRLNYSKSLR